MTNQVHSTAIIEECVVIGAGTSIWDNVHIRRGTCIGRDCIIGGKTYVASGVQIGDCVKINSMVYICYGLTIEDGVMIAAGTVFTNDRFPRAASDDLSTLRSSDPNADTLETIVRSGATIGANCTVGCGLEVGRFAMVGMGSVVTRPVPDFHLVAGNPARHIGYVCRCGKPFCQFAEHGVMDLDAACAACGRRYSVRAGRVLELPVTLPAGADR